MKISLTSISITLSYLIGTLLVPIKVFGIPIMPNSRYSIDFANSVNGQNLSLNEDEQFFNTIRIQAKGTGGNGRPPGHSGGDEQCLAKALPLTPLTPMNKNSKRTFVSTTSQATPTFWFYVPYSAKFKMEFLMVDDRNRPQYQYKLTEQLPGKAGIIGITLPSSKHLNKGQTYFWELRVNCSGNPSVNPVVSGEVQQVTPRSELGLKQTNTSSQNVVLYAKDGLWHETLTTILTKLRSPEKERLLTKLLQAYGLENFVTQPVVRIYSPTGR